MSKELQRAIQMMNEAKPASGFRPETELEWSKLQKAVEELGYARLRGIGHNMAEARRLAVLIHGGKAGRMILEMTYSDPLSDSFKEAKEKKGGANV